MGNTIIPDGTPIEAADANRVLELVSCGYVGYSVPNELYAAVSDEERCEGTRFRVYSKSPFIEYMARATFATVEYPGPTRHYEVAQVSVAAASATARLPGITFASLAQTKEIYPRVEVREGK